MDPAPSDGLVYLGSWQKQTTGEPEEYRSRGDAGVKALTAAYL